MSLSKRTAKDEIKGVSEATPQLDGPQEKTSTMELSSISSEHLEDQCALPSTKLEEFNGTPKVSSCLSSFLFYFIYLPRFLQK